MPEDKFVFLKLGDGFVDIMCEVNTEFIKDVQQEGNKRVLYLRLLKALYGCINSALLWYNTYKDTLENEGFVLNPYDNCTANKMINFRQCTIQWCVDNNKVTHVSEDVITGFVDITKKKFGELVVSRIKKHTFICMEIELVKYGKINIGIQSHIKEAIKTFGEDVSRGATYRPAPISRGTYYQCYLPGYTGATGPRCINHIGVGPRYGGYETLVRPAG